MAKSKAKSIYENLLSSATPLVGIFIVAQLTLCVNQVNCTTFSGVQCIQNSRLKTHDPSGPICKCNRGYCLYNKPEGLKCIKDFRNRYNRRQNPNCNRSYNIATIATAPPEIKKYYLYQCNIISRLVSFLKSFNTRAISLFRNKMLMLHEKIHIFEMQNSCFFYFIFK